MTTSHGPRKRLPENPSEENLRKQAKRLAKQEGLQLAAAQRRLAIDYGYRTWADMMQIVSPPCVPFLPLRALIAFPHEVYPIYIGRGMSIKAVEAAESRKNPILLVAQRDATVAAPSSADMYEIGTLGIMVECLRQPDGTIKTLIEGKKRARVTRYVFDEEFFKAEAEEVEEPNGRTAEIEGLVGSVVSAFAIYAQRKAKISPEIANAIAAIHDPFVLSDKVVRHLNIQLAEQQALLEAASPVERLQKILGHLNAANSS
jgi:ATP-dependent Lon protease